MSEESHSTDASLDVAEEQTLPKYFYHVLLAVVVLVVMAVAAVGGAIYVSMGGDRLARTDLSNEPPVAPSPETQDSGANVEPDDPNEAVPGKLPSSPEPGESAGTKPTPPTIEPEPTPPEQESGASPKTSGGPTVAYWRFEAGKHGVYVRNLKQLDRQAAAEDHSGNGNHLYCEGPQVAPKIGEDVPPGTVSDKGTVQTNRRCLNDTPPGGDKKARFILTRSDLSKPKFDLVSATLPKWTLELSFSLKDLEGKQCLISKASDEPTAEPVLALTVDGTLKRLAISAVDATDAQRTVITGPNVTLEAGLWYHVAVVSDGKQLRLFLDKNDGQGYRRCDNANFDGALKNGTGGWVIGSGFAQGKPINDARALIDEVRVSSVALTRNKFLFWEKPKKPGSNVAGKEPGKEPDNIIETNLLEAVDLPQLSTDSPESMTEVVRLGTVAVRDDTEWSISLIGGEEGHGGEGTFEIYRGEVVKTGPEWRIRISRQEASPIDIARIFEIAGVLEMRWLEGARQSADANQLRNCAINVRLGDENHSVRLRQPLIAQAILMDLGKQGRRMTPTAADVLWLPDPDSIFIEVWLDPDVFGKAGDQRQDPFAAMRGETSLAFGAKGALRIKVASNLRRGSVRLLARPFVRLEKSKKEIAYSYAKLLQAHGTLSARRNTATSLLQEKVALEKKRSLTSEQRARLQEINQYFSGKDLAVIQRAIEAMTPPLQEFNELLSLGDQFTPDVRALIDFSVYRAVGDHKIELINTNGWGRFIKRQREFQTSFETPKIGPLTKADFDGATWTAPAGQAEIFSKFAHSGKQSLRLLGGPHSEIQFVLSKKHSSKQHRSLTFAAERWTSKSPFRFRVEAATADGDWREIFNGDQKIKVGRHFMSRVVIPLPADARRIRMTCRARANTGVVIDDMRLVEVEP